MSIFHINQKCSASKARSGLLTLSNGVVQTPVFMPIGTVGSIKSLSMSEMERLGAEIILGNTYHLWLRPGMEVMQKAGGLHNFNTWQRPILTDSGGFQAFSLSKIRKFSEEGVTFKVPASGEMRFLSPEISMQIQTILNSDIALVLDECLPAEVSESEAKRAMLRTRRWAKRSKIEFDKLQIEKLESGQASDKPSFQLQTQQLLNKFSFENLKRFKNAFDRDFSSVTSSAVDSRGKNPVATTDA